jgi:hypothetical protein
MEKYLKCALVKKEGLRITCIGTVKEQRGRQEEEEEVEGVLMNDEMLLLVD